MALTLEMPAVAAQPNRLMSMAVLWLMWLAEFAVVVHTMV